MGKVGRSYPRFEAVAEPAGAPAAVGEESTFQTRLGAIIGALGAIGLIVWLMALLVR